MKILDLEPHKGRSIDLAKPVDVYRNLHKDQKWSIRQTVWWWDTVPQSGSETFSFEFRKLGANVFSKLGTNVFMPMFEALWFPGSGRIKTPMESMTSE